MARTINKLSVTLDKILKTRGMQDRLQEYRIFALWGPAVGSAIARHAQPRLLRAGKLHLVVDSPAWMQQLSLLKPEIIVKLNDGLGRDVVRDIMLGIGVLPARAEKEAEGDVSAPESVLSAGERKKIEGYIRGINDREIREAVRRVIEKDYARKKAEKK